MKYLAILKDSVREAIDNKVVLVMVGLALLVTLFVLSTGFAPLPAEDMMARLLKGEILRLDDLQGGFGNDQAPRRKKGPFPGGEQAEKKDGKKPIQFGEFVVHRVDAQHGGPVTPDVALRATVGLPLKTKEEADKLLAAPRAQIDRLRGRLHMAEQFQYFTVKEVTGAIADGGPGKAHGDGAHWVYFEVLTEPTPDSRLVWGHEYSLFWGGVPLGGGAPLGLVLFISTMTVLWIGSLVTLLTAVIVTAFFIPNMLRKGTIDLLLVRPISRPGLLIYKYVGGLTFVLFSTAVAVVGMWLALGLRSGVWANSFLLMILVYTFFFAILYAASTLFAVLTRSAVVAILLTCGVWFVLFLVNLFYGLGERRRFSEEIERVPAEKRTSDNAFFTVVRGVHFVLPRTGDLDNLGARALLRDFVPPKVIAMVPGADREPFNWPETLTVSGAFIAVMLGLSCWRFATRDY